MADFLWQASNRRVFMAVKDLVAFELRTAFAKMEIPFSGYYDSGRSHLDALNDARKGKTANQIREALRTDIGKGKQRILDWERGQRKKWASRFGQDTLLPNDWSQFKHRLQEERYFNQVLYGLVETYDLSDRFTNQDIMNLELGILPALSIGIEFYISLQFLLDSQAQNLGKPDRGDLPDMQHAFYAGLCNYFVTDDPRVTHILSNMIKLESTTVISGNAFLLCYLRGNRGKVIRSWLA